MIDLCIIGCGAAGMAAAVAYGMTAPDGEVCILEKKEKPGRKLLATGNGRCNLSNMSCRNVDRTLDFFSSIGVITKADEEGRVYPASGSAVDVLTAMEKQLQAGNTKIITDMAVDSVEKDGDGFLIGKEIRSARVIIASGGKAGPQFGSTGDGYAIAKSLGHSVNRVYPALTGLESDDAEGLHGVRVKGKAVLMKKGAVIAEESGEIQFNDHGFSGICVMDLSRHVTLDGETGFRDYTMRIVTGPERPEDLLGQRRTIKGLTAGDMLLTIINTQLADLILERAGIIKNRPIGDVTDSEIEKIAFQMNNLDFKIRGARGWRKAQCTAGGVPYDQVNEDTMESKIVKGLYFAGEIMDYDGPCGGFNLDHAWNTGIRAGRAAANV